MSRLSRALAAAARGAAWLLPPGRRDWVAAAWAEAHEVPAGLPRLAWRAGGIWMLARECPRPRRVVKATVFLTDLSHFGLVNKVMAEYFREPYPARAAVGVAALPRGAQVEVECIVAL